VHTTLQGARFRRYLSMITGSSQNHPGKPFTFRMLNLCGTNHHRFLVLDDAILLLVIWCCRQLPQNAIYHAVPYELIRGELCSTVCAKHQCFQPDLPSTCPLYSLIATTTLSFDTSIDTRIYHLLSSTSSRK
jgi:hypothetical protein